MLSLPVLSLSMLSLHLYLSITVPVCLYVTACITTVDAATFCIVAVYCVNIAQKACQYGLLDKSFVRYFFYRVFLFFNKLFEVEFLPSGPKDPDWYCCRNLSVIPSHLVTPCGWAGDWKISHAASCSTLRWSWRLKKKSPAASFSTLRLNWRLKNVHMLPLVAPCGFGGLKNFLDSTFRMTYRIWLLEFDF